MEKLNLARFDPKLRELVLATEHRTLGIWATDCAQRVLPYFKDEFPDDKRPGQALKKLREWIRTGEFHMKDVRGYSLGAHAAAREAKGAARLAARACGQAMATAHVKTHSLAAAQYAVLAIQEAKSTREALKEQRWQYRHLLLLQNTGS
jgi:hypothetical protein